MFFYIFMEVKYHKKIAKNPALATPEARLDPALIQSVLLPVGLFWFAWSTDNNIPWIVSVLGGSVFGFGQVLLFISLINYVIDAYTIFAASPLAANAILRALFGAALKVQTLAPLIHNLHVYQPWCPMGVFDPSVSLTCVCPNAVPRPQVWLPDPHAQQAREKITNKTPSVYVESAGEVSTALVSVIEDENKDLEQ
ncbi:hypothetical protein V491_08079 [Pseudogymnoascus sp. VKM F-3775]|nr:hypothetical protein V491_08079 [Pseudogymnoascus sp. VKM F-3775]